jgi:hypothetical protein
VKEDIVMIKHLLIPSTLVLMFLAGCNGDWFLPCDATHTVNCIEQGPGDEGGPCGGDLGTYYVWYRDGACGTKETSLCGRDAADAQAQADSAFGVLWHGSVSTDPHATAPCEVFFSATGTCGVGSSDGSLITSFYVYLDTPQATADEQIAWCEAQYDDPNDDYPCSWTLTNSSCGL